METSTPSFSFDQELAHKLAALTAPGVVFSEPVHEGSVTLVTATQYGTRKGEPFARPVAVIVITPKGVQVKPIRNPVQMMLTWLFITAFVTWGAVMVFHPPWRPEANLVDEIRDAIQAIKH